MRDSTGTTLQGSQQKPRSKCGSSSYSSRATKIASHGDTRRIFMHACERPWAGMMMKDDDHVSEWEKGLPTNDELTPLSQSLISPVLACAFSIKHEPPKTVEEVQRVARASIHNLRHQKQSLPSFDPYPAFREHEDSGTSPYPC